MKIVGVPLVILGTGLVSASYVFPGWFLVLLGLIFLVELPTARIKIPQTYCGLPMAVETNGHFIYSSSGVHSTWPGVILEDGSAVYFAFLRLVVSRGNGPIYILNRSGKLVFPGKN